MTHSVVIIIVINIIFVYPFKFLSLMDVILKFVCKTVIRFYCTVYMSITAWTDEDG